MLLTANMPDALDFEVRDVTGRAIKGVQAYDTETQEIEMYLADRSGSWVLYACVDGYHPVSVKTLLPGSYAVDKTTNKKVG